eukprot:m.119403 g.119403  ORF g.119403 m.119403 type:complete len:237 (-) comp16150_c0_seq1:2032-2742(-)
MLSTQQMFVKAEIAHGSGHASYKELEYQQVPEHRIHQVPLVRATPESTRGFGTMFPYDQYDEQKVEIVPWPRPAGARPIDAGSGVNGGVVEGQFLFAWDEKYLHARNFAVGGDYITGSLVKHSPDGKRREAVLVREANFHPDGGQVVAPMQKGDEFILLLAKPTENITPANFVAFYFDGSMGFQISPGTWHQPAYPLADAAQFKNKQGRVHACVTFDSVSEFDKWMEIPLINMPTA